MIRTPSMILDALRGGARRDIGITSTSCVVQPSMSFHEVMLNNGHRHKEEINRRRRVDRVTAGVMDGIHLHLKKVSVLKKGRRGSKSSDATPRKNSPQEDVLDMTPLTEQRDADFRVSVGGPRSEVGGGASAVSWQS